MLNDGHVGGSHEDAGFRDRGRSGGDGRLGQCAASRGRPSRHCTFRDLVQRSAQALRPGGYLVIEEFQRFQTPREVGELGALSNLYFAATSEAGTWSMKEIAAWQREAGLLPHKPIRLLTTPGAELQAALKPNANRHCPQR